MITSIYSRKGGQGKTPISFALMKEDPKSFYISNDYDGCLVYLDKLRDRSKYISNKNDLKEIHKEDTNIIYDAGGYVSDLTYEMLKKSDLIIVPSIMEEIPLVSAQRLLTEMKKDKNIKAKVILVVTRHENPKNMKDYNVLLTNMFKNLTDEIIYLRKTKFFEIIARENISFNEYVENNPRYRNSGFFEEWKEFKEIYNRYTQK
jgi:cellulose biosynthesis protein BcsQ